MNPENAQPAMTRVLVTQTVNPNHTTISTLEQILLAHTNQSAKKFAPPVPPKIVGEIFLFKRDGAVSTIVETAPSSCL